MMRHGAVLLALVMGVAVPVHAGDVDAPPPLGATARERVAEIHRRIQQAVVYPDLARRNGITGVSRVRFEVGQIGSSSCVFLGSDK
jgi:outer membrane biosynthesis protein TonB